MAIVLRADTGSALTHNQVDTNFTSFFYSSSISGNTLTLFKTGSGALSIAVASSSITLPGGTVWTASAADISRNSDVTITGSFKQGSAGLSATGLNSHAQGISTQAVGWHSHAEGRQTQARESGSHAEGYVTIATGSYSHAEGVGTTALGYGSHAEGESTQAIGQYAHSEGNLTVAYGQGSHAEGTFTLASGSNSHAEGFTATASGSYSHAEGLSTLATGQGSHAEGEGSQATGEASHAEGFEAQSSGNHSHAEGFQTLASGSTSHAEGYQTLAVGQGAHSEGNQTTASGSYSHAEGEVTVALGYASHAEGRITKALGDYSHAEGLLTVAQGNFQHVQGQYNLSSSVESAFIIGNGTADNARRNLVFASGSTFQITGSLNASGSSHIITGSVNVNGTVTAASTITTSGFLYANTIQPTTALILSGDGYNGLKLSGSSTNIFVNSSLTIGSGSYVSSNVAEYVRISSGGLTITSGSGFYLNGTKQFNHAMFSHTASIPIANGTSGSVPLSVTTVAEGISIVSGSRITVANPGDYKIQFAAQLAQGAGTANFYLWFKKNGVNIANTTSVNTLPGNTNELMTVSIMDYAATAGDYYEIAHQSNASNSSLEYIAASGNIPAAPSIIVTVTQGG